MSSIFIISHVGKVLTHCARNVDESEIKHAELAMCVKELGELLFEILELE